MSIMERRGRALLKIEAPKSSNGSAHSAEMVSGEVQEVPMAVVPHAGSSLLKVSQIYLGQVTYLRVVVAFLLESTPCVVPPWPVPLDPVRGGPHRSSVNKRGQAQQERGEDNSVVHGE